MKKKRMLILLGGLWHDFDGFARNMKSILEPQGWSVDATYDFERMIKLEEDNYDMVVSYTSFSKHKRKEDVNAPEKFSDEQLNALTKWVRKGGLFLAVHSATVIGKSSPELGELIGGAFVKHPPACDFTVYPVYGAHPITEGMEAFTVHDELYVQEFNPSVNIHMVAIYDGVAYPMVWSRREVKGDVAYVGMGHSSQVWELEPYRKLILRTVEWLINNKLKKGIVWNAKAV